MEEIRGGFGVSASAGSLRLEDSVILPTIQIVEITMAIILVIRCP